MPQVKRSRAYCSCAFISVSWCNFRMGEIFAINSKLWKMWNWPPHENFHIYNIWHTYSTDQAISIDTKGIDHVTLTLTFLLNIGYCYFDPTFGIVFHKIMWQTFENVMQTHSVQEITENCNITSKITEYCNIRKPEVKKLHIGYYCSIACIL